MIVLHVVDLHVCSFVTDGGVQQRHVADHDRRRQRVVGAEPAAQDRLREQSSPPGRRRRPQRRHQHPSQVRRHVLSGRVGPVVSCVLTLLLLLWWSNVYMYMSYPRISVFSEYT